MMTKHNTVYDAIVVGSGVIGASLALGLALKNNWKVALLEKSPAFRDKEFTPEPNIRATAIGLASKSLLLDLGVWQKLKQSQICAYENMHVWDENSDGELNFAASDYAVEALGFIADHFALQSLLQEAVNQESLVDSYYSCDILSCDTDASRKTVSVKIKQNVDSDVDTNVDIKNDVDIDLRGQWLFAADGVNSAIRDFAGMTTSQHDYHQQGIVAKIRTEHDHQLTAWQRFLSTGPLALLPLDNGECSIVWSASTQQATELCQLSEADFTSRLESALQSRLGKIELCSPRYTFPLKSIRAESYLKGSIVLLGDAAHGIHPMAGQGANLGFGDVDALLTEIGSLPADHPKLYRALRRYERQRKLVNHTMDTFMTGLDEIFRSDNVLVSSLRRIGLKSINKHTMIKEFFAQQVIGKVSRVDKGANASKRSTTH